MRRCSYSGSPVEGLWEDGAKADEPFKVAKVGCERFGGWRSGSPRRTGLSEQGEPLVHDCTARAGKIVIVSSGLAPGSEGEKGTSRAKARWAITRQMYEEFLMARR